MAVHNRTAAAEPRTTLSAGLLLKKGNGAMLQISRRLPVCIEPRTALPMAGILTRSISPPLLIIAGCRRNTETQQCIQLRECHSYRSGRLTEKKLR
jgi:hypothetical protein